eukprot:2271325-Pyramimonas_sp.AAC.1
MIEENSRQTLSVSGRTTKRSGRKVLMLEYDRLLQFCAFVIVLVSVVVIRLGWSGLLVRDVVSTLWSSSVGDRKARVATKNMSQNGKITTAAMKMAD